MRAILLIIFSLPFFGGFAQVKKDNSPMSLDIRSYKLQDTAQLGDHSHLFDNATIIDHDSTYIKIYHAKGGADAGFQPAYYLDSIRVSSFVGMDPNDLLSIKIVKGTDSANKISDKIFVSLKKHPHHFITIQELTKRCIPDIDSKPHPVIYMLDEKLITDTTNMKLEITYIRDVEVVEGSQIKAFTGLLSGLTLLKISTKDAPIYIRGIASPVTFKQ